MTWASVNPPHRSPARRGLRHSGAVILAVAFNAALVLFMVTWLEASRAERPSAMPAVPMEVRPVEPEELEIAEGPAAAPAEPAPPEPREPPVPEPEVLEISTPDLRVPAPPALDTLETPTAASLAVPSYESAAPPAPPAPPRPPEPAGGTGEAEEPPPARVRPSRGPILIRPPGLRDYYPRRARMRGVTGTSRIRLTVDADGRVKAVEVLASSPAGVFEQAARRVGRSLSFRPALRRGRPVPARVTLRLTWRLES